MVTTGFEFFYTNPGRPSILFVFLLSCLTPQVVYFPPIEVSEQIRPQHRFNHDIVRCPRVDGGGPTLTLKPNSRALRKSYSRPARGIHDVPGRVIACCPRVYAPWPTILCASRRYPGTLARPVHPVAARRWMPSPDRRRAAGLRMGLGNMGTRGRWAGWKGINAIAITQNTHIRGPRKAPVAFLRHQRCEGSRQQKTSPRASAASYMHRGRRYFIRIADLRPRADVFSSARQRSGD